MSEPLAYARGALRVFRGEETQLVNDTRRSFMEAVRNLIAGRRGGRTVRVHRGEMEWLGKDLGLAPEVACRPILALHGTVGGVATGSIAESMVSYEESGQLPPPRNWLAITNVYLIR